MIQILSHGVSSSYGVPSMRTLAMKKIPLRQTSCEDRLFWTETKDVGSYQ